MEGQTCTHAQEEQSGQTESPHLHRHNVTHEVHVQHGQRFGFLRPQDTFTSMVDVFLEVMVLALQHCLRASVERWSVQATVLLQTRRFSWITVVFEGMEVLPLSADQWLQWNRIRKHL